MSAKDAKGAKGEQEKKGEGGKEEERPEWVRGVRVQAAGGVMPGIVVMSGFDGSRV